jgi:hypothetical protein
MIHRVPPLHLYTTRGEFAALLLFPYLYSRDGDWTGWVTEERDVFNLESAYVGWVSHDRRILRRQTVQPRVVPFPPPTPEETHVRVPATTPLPPLMAEYSHDVIDVLEEMPELLHPIDSSELKSDMD